MDTIEDADRDGGARVDATPVDAAVVDAALVDAWVEAGIISPEQATRIRAFEAPGSTQESTAPGSTAPGHSVVREVLGYVGAALVAVAGLVLVSDIWDDIGRGWQILLCAVAAAGLTVTAILVEHRYDDRAARRLARSMLLLATLPAGLAVGLAADLVLPENVAVVIGFLGATGFAAAWYARDRSWAQHLALFAATVGVALSLGSATNLEEFLWVTAPLVFMVGIGWTTASTVGVLPPHMIGQVLGCGALGLGSVLLVAAADPETALGVAMLGTMIVVSIVCLVIGARADAVVLIGTGVVGLLGYVPWLVTEVFGNTLGVPIGLALAGAALLGAMARMRT